jgi:Kef-type K+ transport system membrane component KefB
MAEHQIFFEITGVLLLAGVLSLVTGMLKQPSIIAFILTGLVVGPLGFWHLKSPEVLSGLGEVGIALLLFPSALSST